MNAVTDPVAEGSGDVWASEQARGLIEFGKKALVPELGGFGRAGIDGRVDLDRGLASWLNARMAYCYSLDVLRGEESSRRYAEAAARALDGPLWDAEHGGWFDTVRAGAGSNHRKVAYAHAFVLLASSALTAIGSPFAPSLMERVTRTIDERFWDEDEGACREGWAPAWTDPEPYRGMNSNMHMTEAFLAAFDVTGDPRWVDRSERIAGRLIDGSARAHGWRIPEHYTEHWVPDLAYNADRPRDVFRPFGFTMGHSFEWARLLLQLERAQPRLGRDPSPWLQDAAENLFARAWQDGWARNGHPGLAYTIDQRGGVVTPLHLAWVACEAWSAALALHDATRASEYASRARELRAYADAYLVDRRHGSWLMELDERNRPSGMIWDDKADFYHPLQSLLLESLPLAPSLISALSSTPGKG